MKKINSQEKALRNTDISNKLEDKAYESSSNTIPIQNAGFKSKQIKRLKICSSAKRTNWTSEEDSFLINMVNSIGCKWKFISKYFPNKSTLQIFNRYRQVNPNIKRGRFTIEEDKKIVQLVKLHGTDWAKLSAIIKTRSAKQIRARYVFRLTQNYGTGELTDEEKKTVVDNYPLLRNDWKKYFVLLGRKIMPNLIREVIFGK